MNNIKFTKISNTVTYEKLLNDINNKTWLYCICTTKKKAAYIIGYCYCDNASIMRYHAEGYDWLDTVIYFHLNNTNLDDSWIENTEEVFGFTPEMTLEERINHWRSLWKDKDWYLSYDADPEIHESDLDKECVCEIIINGLKSGEIQAVYTLPEQSNNWDKCYTLCEYAIYLMKNWLNTNTEYHAEGWGII